MRQIISTHTHKRSAMIWRWRDALFGIRLTSAWANFLTFFSFCLSKRSTKMNKCAIVDDSNRKYIVAVRRSNRATRADQTRYSVNISVFCCWQCVLCCACVCVSCVEWNWCSSSGTVAAITTTACRMHIIIKYYEWLVVFFSTFFVLFLFSLSKSASEQVRSLFEIKNKHFFRLLFLKMHWFWRYWCVTYCVYI